MHLGTLYFYSPRTSPTSEALGESHYGASVVTEAILDAIVAASQGCHNQYPYSLTHFSRGQNALFILPRPATSPRNNA